MRACVWAIRAQWRMRCAVRCVHSMVHHSTHGAAHACTQPPPVLRRCLVCPPVRVPVRLPDARAVIFLLTLRYEIWLSDRPWCVCGLCTNTLPAVVAQARDACCPSNTPIVALPRSIFSVCRRG